MMNVGEKNKSEDFYAVLGLHKECSATELRIAYEELALRWNPNRCSGLRDSVTIEEAKNKFQRIQLAYSVLSDDNKRFLYDVGAYDSNDPDDIRGMGGFLNEMADLMIQTKPNVEESFEELQKLFRETFQGESHPFGSSEPFGSSSPGSSCSTMTTYCSKSLNVNNKQNYSNMVSDVTSLDNAETSVCSGMVDKKDSKKGKGIGNTSRRQDRKQKVSSQKASSSLSVASNDFGST